MHKVITIPNSIDIIKGSEDLVVDMSDLRFDAPDDKKKFFSFIFIRNSGMKATLSFEKCSYEDKEEFLLMFLTTNIEIQCSILASTWIEILDYSEEIVLPSILNIDEIKRFKDRNAEFTNRVHQFINSLPVYAIYSFHPPYESPMDMSSFEVSDFDGLKLKNFYQLAESDHFPLLLNPSPDENQQPVFFTNIFKNSENNYDMMMIMDKLPYINLLIAMFSDTEKQSTAITAINQLLE